jgi:hypothetical protein
MNLTVVIKNFDDAAFQKMYADSVDGCPIPPMLQLLSKALGFEIFPEKAPVNVEVDMIADIDSPEVMECTSRIYAAAMAAYISIRIRERMKLKGVKV